MTALDLKHALKASVFFTEVQQALQSAATAGDLHKAAAALGSDDFNLLPSEARDGLGALYASRLLVITAWGAA